MDHDPLHPHQQTTGNLEGIQTEEALLFSFIAIIILLVFCKQAFYDSNKWSVNQFQYRVNACLSASLRSRMHFSVKRSINGALSAGKKKKKHLVDRWEKVICDNFKNVFFTTSSPARIFNDKFCDRQFLHDIAGELVDLVAYDHRTLKQHTFKRYGTRSQYELSRKR